MFKVHLKYFYTLLKKPDVFLAYPRSFIVVFMILSLAHHFVLTTLAIFILLISVRALNADAIHYAKLS